MCDYSLQAVASRPAVVGEKLVTTNFGKGTSGFSAANDFNVAICLLPGTELAFDAPVMHGYGCLAKDAQTAIFRQINKDQERTHHDAVEFPDGEVVLLTHLSANQNATVLQLPATPRNEQEAKEQTRLEVVA